MAGEGKRRIIELPEATTVSSGDYFAIDSEGGGTKKIPVRVATGADDLAAVRDSLIEYGRTNLLRYSTKNNETHASITYNWSEDGKTCHISGTASGTSFNTMVNGMPQGFTAGKRYYVLGASQNVHIYVYARVNGSLTTLVNATSASTFTVPINASGLLIRLWIAGGTTVDEDITPVIFSDNGFIVKGGIDKLVTDANDIPLFDESIYFVSSVGGNPTMANAPYFPSWIHTIPGQPVNSGMVIQLAYPYNDGDLPMLRVKKINSSWGAWRVYGGDQNVYNKYITENSTSNTYNITTSPTITTDTNGWLRSVDTDTADETGKTDMTGAIMSMLNDTGYCHLGEGIFYVSGNIDLPVGATLEGCGYNTVIRLLQSVGDSYIARLKQYSTIKGIRFSGGKADGDVSDGNIGGRNGIVFVGNRDGNEPSITPSTAKCSIISDCFFENFSGAGIYCHNSGGGLQEGILATNCYMTLCKAGINIDYWSEYSKFTNIVTFKCYYGCINNGGNNTFTACTFHGTVGFMIDNANGDKQNNAHGSAVGCTFNHIDNWNHTSTLGGGDGVKVINSQNGFIFDGCQFFYGSIDIENSKSMSFTNCLFGGNASYNPRITVTGSLGAFFNGCTFNIAPSINVNAATKFTACYVGDGTEVKN